MVRWIVGSILHGEPIELFLVSTSGESNRSWCVGLILHGPIELFLVSTSGESNCSWCGGSLD